MKFSVFLLISDVNEQMLKIPMRKLNQAQKEEIAFRFAILSSLMFCTRDHLYSYLSPSFFLLQRMTCDVCVQR